jgi:tetratricopeptide (TPR) repeat protein
MDSMRRASRPHGTRTALSTLPGLGERLRQIRLGLGMTQSQLAGDRFSKEYVSQIERGKTRPTEETMKWLADRLGVDPSFLAEGVSPDHRHRVETGLARAEALTESGQLDDALRTYGDLERLTVATGVPALEVRALLGTAKALVLSEQPREALGLLVRARGLSEAPHFSDVERAEILHLMGVCRYRLSSISTAISLFDEALILAERSGLPSDLLRSDILHWRSRCYRRQRDYEAAREDVELALELSAGMSDRRTTGALYFQASLLAEREGHWVLARSYAERAKAQFEEVVDRKNVGRLLNNLGGLNFLLGRTDEAISHLKEAFATALDVGSTLDAAEAVSSLAQVHLRTGDPKLAEQQARHAVQLFANREDALDGVGNAHIVLGRALLEQSRFDDAEAAFFTAEKCFAKLSSASHSASAWIAQGDLATRRGNDRAAAHLYRRAAEALQDVRF